ncbi:ABC transporter permease [Streptomyces sp. N2-109]|uniref:ABC transporter permease n=1 Tax=Streptomyces gossypii TaxID=2883101 RepID=A0ABT2K1D8_9ACTN|nr:ABC transporter permease [Streptomyces gossypii]MCT2593963.1 ABC transporter permease [Streptomyces gossypii]
MRPLAPVLRSEWAKIRSVRALQAALLALLLGSTGISLLACGLYDGPGGAAEDFEPVLRSFYGLPFGQIAAVCFGVLVVTSEYSHGGVRLSLAAVPRRGLLLLGKLAVTGGLALTAGLFTGLVSVGGGQALLGEHGTDLAAPGALRAALGCGLYLMLLTLLAAGTAVLVRGPVAALGILVPLLFLLAPVVGTESQVIQFLPDQAGQQILHPQPDGTLGAWTGLAVMAGWAALAVGAGGTALQRRDA